MNSSNSKTFVYGMQQIRSDGGENTLFFVSSLIFGGLVLIFVLCSNAMLIYGFYKTSDRPFSTIKKLFIYMSVMDMLAVVFAVVRSIIYACIPTMKTPNVTASVLSRLFHVCGVNTFCTISTLRLLSIKRPFYHITNAFVLGMLLFEFFVSGIYACLPYIFHRLDTAQYSPVIVLIINIFVLCVNLSSYNALNAKKKTQKPSNKQNQHIQVMTDLTSSDTVNISQDHSYKHKTKAIKTLLVITAFYLACYVPMCTYMFFRAHLKSFKESPYFDLIGGLLFMLLLANGGINATTYILRTHKIRILFCKA